MDAEGTMHSAPQSEGKDPIFDDELHVEEAFPKTSGVVSTLQGKGYGSKGKAGKGDKRARPVRAIWSRNTTWRRETTKDKTNECAKTVLVRREC